MLAHNWKTAAELQITEEEHEALSQVYHGLCDGTIAPIDFDMNEWPSSYCGTIRCIGGHMTAILGYCNCSSGYRCHNTLSALFYPFHPNPRDGVDYEQLVIIKRVWKKISPLQGAQAIDNFFRFADAKWETIVQPPVLENCP